MRARTMSWPAVLLATACTGLATAQSRPATDREIRDWTGTLASSATDGREAAWLGLRSAGPAAVPGILAELRSLPLFQVMPRPGPRRPAAPARQSVSQVPHPLPFDIHAGTRLEDWLRHLSEAGFGPRVHTEFLATWSSFEPDPQFAAAVSDGTARLIALLGSLGAPAADAVPELLVLVARSATLAPYAAWALGRMGHEALGPALIQLRTEPDGGHPGALWLLIYVVGRIGRAQAEDAARALMPFLADANPANREMAYHSLIRLGRGAVPGLMSTYREPDPVRRYFALGILCRILRGAELWTLLREALDDPHERVRNYAMAVAGRAALEAGGDGTPDALVARLRALSESEQPTPVPLLLALAACGGRAAPARPAAERAILSRSVGTRTAGLLFLIRVPPAAGSPAAAALAELLAEASVDSAAAIVTALGATRPRGEHARQLAELMEQTWARFSGPRVDARGLQTAVLQVLAELALDTPALRKILADTRGSGVFELRAAAELVRARLDGAGVVAELIDDLRARHSFDRRVAAQVLGTLASPAARAPLQAALATEGHEETRAALAAALARLLTDSRPADR